MASSEPVTASCGENAKRRRTGRPGLDRDWMDPVIIGRMDPGFNLLAGPQGPSPGTSIRPAAIGRSRAHRRGRPCPAGALPVSPAGCRRNGKKPSRQPGFGGCRLGEEFNCRSWLNPEIWWAGRDGPSRSKTLVRPGFFCIGRVPDVSHPDRTSGISYPDATGRGHPGPDSKFAGDAG